MAKNDVEKLIKKSSLDFILHLTDYFHGHWEDLGWGRLPSTQILIAIAVRELASGIQDEEFRSQIYAVADKVVALNSQAFTRD
ncbi:MAG: hypothetical protein ACR65R_07300 [Methylomicrobium sp.]